MKARCSASTALLGIVAALALWGPLALARTATHPGLKAEIRVAAIHAGLAVDMHRIALIHLHLHHLINCLVGVGSHQFDPRAGNPCKGLGNGAIPDSPVSGSIHFDLMHALRLAQSGERATAFAPAHHLAVETLHVLLLAKRSLVHG